MITAKRVVRGRRPTPGVKAGVSEQAAQLVRQAYEAIETSDNKTFSRMYAYALERKVYHSDHHLFLFMKHLTHAPVGIEEFLDSTEFLAATDISLWPEVRKAIIEINSDWWKGPNEAYHEAVLMGSTSSGKSEISKITTLYHLYLLSCIDSPQALYGLPKTTSIVFAIMAAKPHVTKKVLYVPLRQMIEAMPYFQKHMRPERLVESEMIFTEKNLRVVPGGSDADSILGEAIIGGIIDEINFMNVVLKSRKAEVTTGRSGVYDQAQTIHSAMTRRKKGRFISQGPQIGVICTSSSTRYKGDFTDKRKQQVIKNNEKGVFLYDRPQYEVWPQDRYCGEKFRLLVGNDIISDTRILKEDEKVTEGSMVLNIPVEYLADFQRDPHSALRDVCGVSTSSISPFFKRRFKIYEAVDKGAEAGLVSFLQSDNVVLGVHDMPRVNFGHYCLNPSRPRYVHIDLSTTGDKCVAEGQSVLMADGTRQRIERVRVGDLIISHDGTERRVAQTHSNGMKPVLSVFTYGWGDPLRVTSTHRVWAVKRSAVSYTDGRLVKPSDPMFSRRSGKAAKLRYSYVPEFVEMGELGVGDFLVTPRPVQGVYGSIGGVETTYAAGYIAGLFAAEGSFYEHHGSEYAQFSLHSNEVKILEQLSGFLLETFSVTTRLCRNQNSQGVTLRTTKSEALVHFLLTTVGEYSHRKTLSCWRYGSSMFHAGLCHGYVDGDGHVRYTEDGTPKAFRTKSVSKEMATSFYWVLVANGFTPALNYDEAYMDSVGVSHRQVYHVSLSGEAAMRKFASWSTEVTDTPCSMAVALEGYILSPIRLVEDGGETAVYDLTVEGVSSYIVGNSAVHNCGIAMVRFDGLVDVERSSGLIEKLPQASVELACSIQPDANNELQFAEVRAWVKQLRDVYGYPIKAVTYDGIFSIESVQQWRKQGMKTGHVSVDKTSIPYKQLRDTFNDGRLAMFDQPHLISELFELEFDETKDKVDHPVHGSKDCIVGTTRIPLLNGASVPIQELVGEEFWVYSCTPEGRVVPALAHNVHKVGDTAAVVLRVHLDDGGYLDCTPDHEIMRRDGTFVAAELLGEGDSLMPLYRRVSVANSSSALNGYEQVLDNATGKYVFTHQRVAEDTLGFTYGRSKGDRKVLHHKDFDKRNNSPDNLQVMGWKEHRDYHNRVGATNFKELWKTEKFRKAAALRSGATGRVTGSRNITAYNKSEGRVRKLQASGLFSRNGTKVMNALWADPAYRAAHTERLSGRKCPWYRDLGIQDIMDAVHLGITSKKEILRHLRCNDRVFNRTVEQAGYTPYSFATTYLDRARANHKVVKVERLRVRQEVYDMTVDVHHNFAIEAGIFIHNCADAVCGAYYSMLQRRASWLALATDEEVMANDGRADFGERAVFGGRQ